MRDAANQSASGQRIVVTGGGIPDAAELAALVVALTPVSGAPPQAAGPPAWRHAALLEGVGGARVLAPSDLALDARPR